jgi:Cys-tRNA(Pro)/Cys-tRNA(Cys) deacylase
MSVTQAMRFLKQKKIDHRIADYDHKVKGAVFAAEALDWPVEAMVKTLVVNMGGRDFALCLMPGDLELSLKKLARAAGVKAARMATEEEAQKLTGYLIGGISPFGTKKQLDVWMHGSIPTFDEIGINAGRRGTMAFLNPSDAVTALSAKVADIAM